MARTGLAAGIALFAIFLAALGGVALLVTDLARDDDAPRQEDSALVSASGDLASAAPKVTPFTNVGPRALTNGSDLWPDQVWNYRPSVVVFDYDRDKDLDFYVTAEQGHPNFLYRNDGDASFVNVAEASGVAALDSHGAVACDVDNDGYQDLYVGARSVGGSRLDYRSAEGDDPIASGLHEAIKDRLFVNNGDGTFTEVTGPAFGDDVNLRSAASIACADVDGDGWLDIFVGDLVSEDFCDFTGPDHPGHYNVLFQNNGDYDLHRYLATGRSDRPSDRSAGLRWPPGPVQGL